MGARGYPPAPTRLKMLRGETRPSRIGTNPAQARPLRPKMPPDLSPEAKRHWRHALRTQAPGIILAAHAPTLRLYCETLARWDRAQRELEASTLLIQAGGHGARAGEVVKNPLVLIVRDAADQARVLARELLLTPASIGPFAGRRPPPLDGPLLSRLKPRLRGGPDPA
jgi:phage terminase small subunit